MGLAYVTSANEQFKNKGGGVWIGWCGGDKGVGGGVGQAVRRWGEEYNAKIDHRSITTALLSPE